MSFDKMLAEYTRYERIARIVHEANRAYCVTIGDLSQVPWDVAPEWQRESCRLGVKSCLENPNITPEENHNNWLAIKRSEGWTYGLVKDASFKTHPCCAPYDQLPESQRLKDRIFIAIVNEFRPAA